MAARLLCTAAAFGLAVGAASAEVRIWTEVNTRRVLRSEAPAANAPAGASLAAARNETRGFQVLLRADAPATVTELTVLDLRGPGNATITADHVTPYRQHALRLDEASYRNEAFVADWYPDALIPFAHPLTGGPLEGRFAALPLELPAGETHGFWLDVAVPADAAAGNYTGEVKLGLAGGATLTVPVMLTVWDFALPETPSAYTALGSPRLRGYYKARAEAGKEPEPADWAAVDDQVAALLAEHRINAAPPAWAAAEQPDGSFKVPDAEVDAVRAFIDRYHVNAISMPHPRSVIKDPVAETDRLKRWLAAWDDALARLDRPGVVPYIYLKDEPNDQEEYEYVQTWGRAIKALNPAVKLLVVEQTLTQNAEWGDLNGAVDIWCPLFSLHDPATAAERRAAGELVWTYTALCQRNPTPWWLTDQPLLNYRVPLWQAWREGMSGILYWGGMSYWTGVEDPWTDPRTLDRRKDGKGPLYNGEGSLLYPGRAAGYDGIAPSLRLKSLRDGLQDYDYLALLAQRTSREQADAVAAPLAESFFQWETDPAAYERARAELARRIVAAQ